MIDLSKLANKIFPDDEHKPFRVGVIAMAPSGNCLSVLRSKTQRFPETWGAPGGQIDAGETAAQAAIREFEEETGGKLTSIIPLLYNQQGGFTFLTFLGFCDEEFVPVLDYEHTAHRWSPFNQWPQPASPAMQSLIEDDHTCGIIAQCTALKKTEQALKPLL